MPSTTTVRPSHVLADQKSCPEVGEDRDMRNSCFPSRKSRYGYGSRIQLTPLKSVKRRPKSAGDTPTMSLMPTGLSGITTNGLLAGKTMDTEPNVTILSKASMANTVTSNIGSWLLFTISAPSEESLPLPSTWSHAAIRAACSCRSRWPFVLDRTRVRNIASQYDESKEECSDRPNCCETFRSEAPPVHRTRRNSMGRCIERRGSCDDGRAIPG